MGFAYSEDMWDKMYASAGGYETWSKSNTSIETSDGETFVQRPNDPAVVALAATMPTVTMDQWNAAAEISNPIALAAGNVLAQQRIDTGITKYGVPQPVTSIVESPEYTRDDIRMIVKILKGVDLQISGTIPEFTESDMNDLLLYLKG